MLTTIKGHAEIQALTFNLTYSLSQISSTLNVIFKFSCRNLLREESVRDGTVSRFYNSLT